jgi:hypothetical protein
VAPISEFQQAIAACRNREPETEIAVHVHTATPPADQGNPHEESK